MDVRTRQDEASGAAVLSLYGQLAIDTSGDLAAALDDLAARSVYRVVVDLGGLAFCDSTGLSALVIAYHRCRRAGGYLRLAAPSPFLLRVLTVVGIRDALPVYETVAAACAGDPAGLVAPAPAPVPDPPPD